MLEILEVLDRLHHTIGDVFKAILIITIALITIHLPSISLLITLQGQSMMRRAVAQASITLAILVSVMHLADRSFDRSAEQPSLFLAIILFALGICVLMFPSFEIARPISYNACKSHFRTKWKQYVLIGVMSMIIAFGLAHIPMWSCHAGHVDHHCHTWSDGAHMH